MPGPKYPDYAIPFAPSHAKELPGDFMRAPTMLERVQDPLRALIGKFKPEVLEPPKRVWRDSPTGYGGMGYGTQDQSGLIEDVDTATAWPTILRAQKAMAGMGHIDDRVWKHAYRTAQHAGQTQAVGGTPYEHVWAQLMRRYPRLTASLQSLHVNPPADMEGTFGLYTPAARRIQLSTGADSPVSTAAHELTHHAHQMHGSKGRANPRLKRTEDMTFDELQDISFSEAMDPHATSTDRRFLELQRQTNMPYAIRPEEIAARRQANLSQMEASSGRLVQGRQKGKNRLGLMKHAREKANDYSYKKAEWDLSTAVGDEAEQLKAYLAANQPSEQELLRRYLMKTKPQPEFKIPPAPPGWSMVEAGLTPEATTKVVDESAWDWIKGLLPW